MTRCSLAPISLLGRVAGKISFGQKKSRGKCAVAAAILLTASACAPEPLSPYTTDTPPLILLPLEFGGVTDQRGRFREIFCHVLETRGTSLPDYRPCEEALTRVGSEPAGGGRPVRLDTAGRQLQILLVPGVGWDCFAEWLELTGAVGKHLRELGYGFDIIEVDSLSSSAANAGLIRDALLERERADAGSDIVLVGYSKGATDILEAIVSYPEIRSQLAAVVSVAGSVGGSPLANDAQQSDLAPLQYWPGARCTEGDGGAIESLLPSVRKSWLAQNPLPEDLRYYSLVTYPDPENISAILELTYDDLAQVDARNDSQLLFYDQIIPGGALLAYLNADHWAVGVPIARAHAFIGGVFVDKNAYPREALMEAIVRFIEEDLSLASEPQIASTDPGR